MILMNNNPYCPGGAYPPRNLPKFSVYPDSSTNDPARRLRSKRQQKNLTHVLHRSVEVARPFQTYRGGGSDGKF